MRGFLSFFFVFTLSLVATAEASYIVGGQDLTDGPIIGGEGSYSDLYDRQAVYDLGEPAVEGPSVAVSADPTGAPEGFGWHVVTKDDDIRTLAGTDWAVRELFERVNRMDHKNLTPGMRVLVPIDMERASRYVPVLREIGERGRRIVVYVDSQYFGVYEGGTLLFWGAVSTGKEGRTPRRHFTISRKQTDRRSMKYDAGMPWSLQLSGSDYFLHLGPLPGYAASHGCIRILYVDSRRLFEWARVGDTVVVR